MGLLIVQDWSWAEGPKPVVFDLIVVELACTVACIAQPFVIPYLILVYVAGASEDSTSVAFGCSLSQTGWAVEMRVWMG
mgnify:CR=1 FL=1